MFETLNLSISTAVRVFSMGATRNLLADFRATEVNQDPSGRAKVTARSLRVEEASSRALASQTAGRGPSFAQRPRHHLPCVRSEPNKGRPGARSASPHPPTFWRKRRS